MIWEIKKQIPVGWVTVATCRSLDNAQDVCRALQTVYPEVSYEIFENSNPRDAGRIPVYSDAVHEDILRRRADGQTIRQIADDVGCSKSFVHKIINGQNE